MMHALKTRLPPMACSDCGRDRPLNTPKTAGGICRFLRRREQGIPLLCSNCAKARGLQDDARERAI